MIIWPLHSPLTPSSLAIGISSLMLSSTNTRFLSLPSYTHPSLPLYPFILFSSFRFINRLLQQCKLIMKQYYEGNLADCLIHLYPDIGLQKPKFNKRKPLPLSLSLSLSPSLSFPSLPFPSSLQLTLLIKMHKVSCVECSRGLQEQKEENQVALSSGTPSITRSCLHSRYYFSSSSFYILFYILY